MLRDDPDRMAMLTGGQTKLDANKDGKISGEDFAMLREENKEEREEMQEGGMMLPDEEMQESDTKTVNLNYNVSSPAKEEQPFLLKEQEEDMMDEEVKRSMVSARPYVRS